MTKYFIFGILLVGLLSSVQVTAQETYKEKKPEKVIPVYQPASFHQVKQYDLKFKSRKPENIILMIGDGMGVSQVFAGMTANGGHLFLDNFRHIGFIKTQSADNYITDSAAAGTAISTGVRTYNGAIAVDMDQNPIKTILEQAEEKGLATGLVSTSAITHATPAAFIAHQGARRNYELIASDFLKTDIDVFIGGGYKHFTQREDGRNLVDELKKKGYLVLRNMDEIKQVSRGKLAGLTAPEHNERYSVRGDMLPLATATAVNILNKNKRGFFLMVEGAQIDWGGHGNQTPNMVEEMLDFDRSIGKALEFAASDGKTLIIVTADHETGGVAVTGGNLSTGKVECGFISTNHTAVMVPVFAYGPGAEYFTGIMENTDIYLKMRKLLIDR
jgi:alkaline phosphatase